MLRKAKNNVDENDSSLALVPDRTKPFTLLPEEIVVTIFLLLSEKALCLLSTVCQQWHRLSRDNAIWKEKYEARFLNKTHRSSRYVHELNVGPKYGWLEQYKFAHTEEKRLEEEERIRKAEKLIEASRRFTRPYHSARVMPFGLDILLPVVIFLLGFVISVLVPLTPSSFIVTTSTSFPWITLGLYPVCWVVLKWVSKMQFFGPRAHSMSKVPINLLSSIYCSYLLATTVREIKYYGFTFESKSSRSLFFCDELHEATGFELLGYAFHFRSKLGLLDTALLLFFNRDVTFIHYFATLSSVVVSYATAEMPYVWLVVLFNSAQQTISYCYFAIFALTYAVRWRGFMVAVQLVAVLTGLIAVLLHPFFSTGCKGSMGPWFMHLAQMILLSVIFSRFFLAVRYRRRRP